MAECRDWMEQISASIDGELSPEEEEALQEHLETCADCRAAMALLRSMAQVMREDTVRPPEKLAEGTRYLFEQEKKNRGFSLKRWRFTAVAAVICLALFGVVKLAPWSAGGKSAAAPMAKMSMATETDHKTAAPAASAAAVKDMSAEAGGAAEAEVPEAAEESEPAPGEQSYLNGIGDAPAQASAEEPKSTLAAASAEMRAGGAASAPMAPQGDAGKAEADDALPGAAGGDDPGTNGTIYYAGSLPGYAIYSNLEGAETYYSVCFVDGPVPETIRMNRECAPLDAPEGQERWLVPRSVCVNEGLLEQFSEVYYGDLLSQQGLVIGILDMEEDQWQP